MTTRMEKYHLSNSENGKRRSEKNNHLYEEMNNNKVYTEYINISNNAISLDDIVANENSNKREDYMHRKMINQEEMVPPRKKVVEEKKLEAISLDEKDYNIHDVLSAAKKNRRDLDEEEKKKHVKTVEYNILSDLNEEREKQEKNKKLTEKEAENLEELIHTITSNSLRKKIDEQLLTDLMPTEEIETIVSEHKLVEEDEKLEDTMDKSFYTKSMDLSEEDFEFDDEKEDNSFVEENHMGIGKKIIIAVVILCIIAMIGYVGYQLIIK